MQKDAVVLENIFSLQLYILAYNNLDIATLSIKVYPKELKIMSTKRYTLLLALLLTFAKSLKQQRSISYMNVSLLTFTEVISQKDS